MAVVYSVTDSKGTIHTRTSRGHTSPRYTHAVVWTPGVSRVSYASSRLLIEKAYAEARKYGHDKAEIVEVKAVVK